MRRGPDRSDEVTVDRIAQIERAFAGVPRGLIGLREANALDDRLDETDPAALVAFRLADIETDWRKIPEKILLANPSVFSFLDDAGLKFVIPAVFTWFYKNPNASSEVPEFLYYSLLPTTRRSREAKTLISELKFTPDQTRVIFTWLQDMIAAGKVRPSAFDLTQLAKWEHAVAQL